MTPAEKILREEIAAAGPIPFSRFMSVALYHPEFGYYRRAHDPFGRKGDFYTAEQLQPVFGRLIRSLIHLLASEIGDAPDLTVVELGAGRKEMEPYLSEFRYIPVDLAYGALPESFQGVVFANEFFDALPVDLRVVKGGRLFERNVGVIDTRLAFVDGVHIREEAGLADGTIVEIRPEAERWLERISTCLTKGFVITVDYGYTRREQLRFRSGSLMSYHRHQALEDVLSDPGERDITAHVSFTDLQEAGEKLSLTTRSFETLGQVLVRAGKADNFESVLRASGEGESLHLRMQLKALLFGMGETFRVLVQEQCRRG
ncbi:MAG TPA: SAM-dependent methyltransferase [Bryobacteraceae bacterium]|nr:SAM-dependent methyltransferase [Bryobacteraceae bacterium]